MKCGVNPPFDFPEMNVGSIVYGLAHEAQRDVWYRTHLQSCAESTRYTILDNGADELGTGMKGDEYAKLIREIKPDEIILPDVLGDTEQTLFNSQQFFEEYYHHLGYEPKMMGVAQGLTFDDWERCYNRFAFWASVDVIGIPYDIEFDVPGCDASAIESKTQRRALRRYELVRYLHLAQNTSKPIHLLGMNNLDELCHYRDNGLSWRVRSNDTTAPFAAASEHRKWLGNRYEEKDWKALDFSVEWSDEQEEIAWSNLYDYVSACGDLNAAHRIGAEKGNMVDG